MCRRKEAALLNADEDGIGLKGIGRQPFLMLIGILKGSEEMPPNCPAYHSLCKDAFRLSNFGRQLIFGRILKRPQLTWNVNAPSRSEAALRLQVDMIYQIL